MMPRDGNTEGDLLTLGHTGRHRRLGGEVPDDNISSLDCRATADDGTRKCTQSLEVTTAAMQGEGGTFIPTTSAMPDTSSIATEPSHSEQSKGSLATTPRATTGNVPLHVRIVVVVSIVLLAINATLLIVNTAATMDSHAQYARSYEIKRALSTFQSVITAAESGQRGYLLTGQTGYLEPYYVAMRSWRTEIDRLRNLTADNVARQRDIAELERLTAAAISRLKATISRSPQPGPNGTADVAGTERATTTMDRVRGIVDRMIAEEDARIEALRREVLRDLLVAGGIALLTTVVTVAVLIGLNKLLRRYVRDREAAEDAM